MNGAGRLTASPAYKAYFFTMAKVSDPFAMSCVLSTAGLAALIVNSLVVVRWGVRVQDLCRTDATATPPRHARLVRHTSHR